MEEETRKDLQFRWQICPFFSLHWVSHLTFSFPLIRFLNMISYGFLFGVFFRGYYYIYIYFFFCFSRSGRSGSGRSNSRKEASRVRVCFGGNDSQPAAGELLASYPSLERTRETKKRQREEKNTDREKRPARNWPPSRGANTHTHTQAAIWELKTLARRIQWKVSHAAVGYLQPSDSLCSFRPLTLSILTHENKQQAQFFSASIGSSY